MSLFYEFGLRFTVAFGKSCVWWLFLSTKSNYQQASMSDGAKEFQWRGGCAAYDFSLTGWRSGAFQ